MYLLQLQYLCALPPRLYLCQNSFWRHVQTSTICSSGFYRNIGGLGNGSLFPRAQESCFQNSLMVTVKLARQWHFEQGPTYCPEPRQNSLAAGYRISHGFKKLRHRNTHLALIRDLSSSESCWDSAFRENTMDTRCVVILPCRALKTSFPENPREVKIQCSLRSSTGRAYSLIPTAARVQNTQRLSWVCSETYSPFPTSSSQLNSTQRSPKGQAVCPTKTQIKPPVGTWCEPWSNSWTQHSYEHPS